MRPSRQGVVKFDGRDLADLERARRSSRRPPPVRFPVPDGRPVRQPDDLRQRRLRAPRARPANDRDPSTRIVAERLQEVGLPGPGDRRSRPSFPAASGSGSAWPGPGAGPRGHALRRADDRPRPDHDRRHQRADPPDPADQEGDRRGGHSRDEDRGQGRRPGGHALPPVHGSARRAPGSSTTARPSRWKTTPTPASASSSGARPASGSRK